MIDAWPFILLALAAWRTWYLLAFDTLFNRPRGDLAPEGSDRAEFVECPYCFGFWVGLVWVFGWSQAPELTQWIALPLALSAAVVLIDATMDKLRGE